MERVYTLSVADTVVSLANYFVSHIVGIATIIQINFRHNPTTLNSIPNK